MSNTLAPEIDRDQSAPPKEAETSARFNPRRDRSDAMSKDRIEGAAQKAVGAAKQAIGKAVGNPKLQAEGVADKIIGAAKESVGELKDVAHKATR
jgi:uncharacterized protein YjbJ (UPF0337 family)